MNGYKVTDKRRQFNSHPEKKLRKNKPLEKQQKKALVDKLEKQLHKLVDKIYDLSVSGRRIIPRHPYILVRVLPKEHTTPGGLILPETDQNKPVYEGIVISTWQPYTERRAMETKDGKSMGTYVIYHECDVKPGDRVCFPHYEGIALGEYLDNKYYRLIREGTDQNKSPYCSVAGIIKYDGDAEILAQISELTKKLGSVTTSGVPVSRGYNPPVIHTPA